MFANRRLQRTGCQVCELFGVYVCVDVNQNGFLLVKRVKPEEGDIQTT